MGILLNEIQKLDAHITRTMGPRTENCITLKKFLEGLVSQGHLAEYVKKAEKAKKKEDDDSDEDEEPIKKLANRQITGIIDVINSTTARDDMRKNAIRVHQKGSIRT